MSTTNKGKTIGDLREVLFATLEGVRNGTMDLDKARQVNEIAKTITETAKVEVDYLRVTAGDKSVFLADEKEPEPALPDGITRSVVHRMR